MSSMECSIAKSKSTSNESKHCEAGSPDEIARQLQALHVQLQQWMVQAAEAGLSLNEVERVTWASVLQMGFRLVEFFIRLQGNGDLGKEVKTKDDRRLVRSDQPSTTTVRSIFGPHQFQQYTYSRGPRKKIELRPISTRMLLPEHEWTYLRQEYSQMFCVDQAFNQAATNLQTVFGSPFPVDTLEQTAHRMGKQADAFLDALPVPKPKSESELLVASADCKGVPLIKEQSEPVAAFETRRKRPGTRRMATVASVYTVDRYHRTAEQIVEAIFREQANEEERPKRPRPTNKQTTAHLPTVVVDEGVEVPINSIHEGVSWLADRVHKRHRDGQELVLLMDGQECLWSTAETNLSDLRKDMTEILDIIHASTYVWEASSLFETTNNGRKAFTKERLLKILHGEVRGVIRGLRRLGSLKGLRGQKLEDLRRICSYLEKNQHRMQYDRYLAAGYPIASGVIEGACAHLVKDRMERSGMRWTLEGARSMLNLRAAFQSDYWEKFCKQRICKLNKQVHPHAKLLDDYKPLSLSC